MEIPTGNTIRKTPTGFSTATATAVAAGTAMVTETPARAVPTAATATAKATTSAAALPSTSTSRTATAMGTAVPATTTYVCVEPRRDRGRPTLPCLWHATGSFAILRLCLVRHAALREGRP